MPQTGHLSSVESVTFSPDGRILASGSWDNMVKLWEVATAREIRTLQGHSSSVRGVTFSPDGRILASGSWDNTVKLWEVSSGELLCTLLSYWGDGRWVACTPDGIFDVSPSAMDLLWFRDGLVVYPAKEFAAELHHPEELQARIKKAALSLLR